MIEFKNVQMVYSNGTKALDGVNLTINDGEFVFIVGASGAGKSTLIKLLFREEKISGGTLTVDNFDLTKLQSYKVPYYRRRIGVVFQDFRLFPKMTVFENVAFAMRVIGENERTIARRVPVLLSTVGLSDKARNLPDELSGGQQQRVALARALANNPDIILADEPTGNVDPKMSLEIMNLLKRVNECNKTVIVVTHASELVDQMHQRVVTIRNGTVIEDRAGGAYHA